MDYRLYKIIEDAPIEYLPSVVAGAVKTTIKSNKSDGVKLADIREIIWIFETRFYGEEKNENATQD